MKINIERLTPERPFHMRASSDLGATVDIDAAPDIGGTDQGMRPMELMLTSIGTCSAIDVIHIMRRQRQELRDIRISVRGDRVDTHPRVFTDIHMHFDLFGEVDPVKVEKAVSLSVEKYCTAVRMVEKMANITYDFTIHP